MKRLFKFRYPKILILIIAIVASYFIFKSPQIMQYLPVIEKYHYIGIFISGILLVFGFTAPLAIGLFVSVNPSNIFLAAIVGGAGAAIADIALFNIIKVSFMDEFRRLEKTKIIKEIEKDADYFGEKPRHYFMYAFAGIIIASPLPDEVGIAMLSGLGKINQKVLGILAFILHTLAIYLFLNI